MIGGNASRPWNFRIADQLAQIGAAFGLSGQFVRFLLVGGINTLVGYGLFYVALQIMPTTFSALVVSTLLGVTFNFFSTGRLVFASHDPRRIFTFFGGYLIVFLYNAAGLALLVGPHLPASVAGALLLPGAVIISYSFNKLVVFRSASAQPAAEATRWLAKARIGVITNQTVFAFASAMLFLPGAILATSFKPLIAVTVVAGYAGAFLIAVSGVRADSSILARPVAPGNLSLAILAAGAILLLGGEMHIFHAPFDWRIRDAVLSDLAAHGFPIIYEDRGAYILRAPLGMYMAPALIGRAFGLNAAHIALWAQNSLFLGCIFYMLGALGAGYRHVAIMILSSGFALFGIAILMGLGATPPPEKLVRFGLDSWSPYFQYSSSVVQFFWVPNHALPGWWLAVVLLLRNRGEIDLASTAAPVGGALVWSPLVILLPALWCTALIASRPHAALKSRRLWLLALCGACLAPIAVFLATASTSIKYGLSVEREYFALFYCIFISANLWQAAYVFAHRSLLTHAQKQLFLFAVGGIVLLPLMRFGPANDLVMRGSIPLLTIIAFFFAATILDSRTGALSRGLGLALVLLCSASAGLEAWRALMKPAYAPSTCSLFEAARALGDDGVPTNYVAEIDRAPSWLLDANSATRVATAQRGCWAGKIE